MNDINLQSKFKNYVVRTITKEGVAINSEVDLEKELKRLIGNVGQCDRRLAEHFFELGLKARKGG